MISDITANSLAPLAGFRKAPHAPSLTSISQSDSSTVHASEPKSTSDSVYTSESLSHTPTLDSIVMKDVPRIATHAKGQLPDTGQSSPSDNVGMIGAITAILGGLGFMKRSRKDKHQE
ncbi:MULTISPECIES: MSCRAMM family adhesin [unclassified Staphylococcus]|uniref:LPXTG cell wall anchor domain-containing protein n=1 Tax=unclassified Staphylococcus TaxID=91994 RepID=UPI0021D0A937|nr:MULTISPECIES: MSCRAMM family adhesin [unclassified Staphylococcus]UXR79342.1 MSCRAMM family adhesin [Staphylococcus sp. IVB6227]UXR83478.1 MSCRAMM family adhesin [Staphylococcus sp. IVB6214]